VIETRVCQYEVTSNEDFLIDRRPMLTNVWLAGGRSGLGFEHGPAVGEYVTRLLVKGEPPIYVRVMSEWRCSLRSRR
jgi:glycine/D-amino acid oxidase-like deaminating enzyme